MNGCPAPIVLHRGSDLPLRSVLRRRVGPHSPGAWLITQVSTEVTRQARRCVLTAMSTSVAVDSPSTTAVCQRAGFEAGGHV